MYDADGKKVLYMSGAWNSHLEYQRCDEEGVPLPDEAPVRVWEVDSLLRFFSNASFFRLFRPLVSRFPQLLNIWMF